MKPNPLIKAVVGLGVITAAIANTQIAQAQNRFFCNTSQMSTVVQTERGAVPLIRWTDRSFPPPYTPQQRCQIVSERFKKFDNNGTLKYIKADRMNNLPVLCIAAYKGGSCLPNGLLVTFKPGTNANKKLVEILDRRVWALGGAVELNSQGSRDLVSQVNGEIYLNMEMLLELSDQEPK